MLGVFACSLFGVAARVSHDLLPDLEAALVDEKADTDSIELGVSFAEDEYEGSQFDTPSDEDDLNFPVNKPSSHIIEILSQDLSPY